MDEHKAVESDVRSHQAEDFTAVFSLHQLMGTVVLLTAILSASERAGQG
jgi:hypothetical protein